MKAIAAGVEIWAVSHAIKVETKAATAILKNTLEPRWLRYMRKRLPKMAAMEA